MSVIKPINRDTVHRICSGQVVLNLAIAVKELVENAIDASATNIEVRLKEYGSELVEVSDNGSGVTKENFQALTQKHCTSKLQEFSDLESIGTLGFRGEALSSLCALSNLTITTRHETAEYATRIVYDHNGLIINEIPTAREKGTTVSLSGLFSSLPVRRKEFMKNLKKEFSKMCQLLYAYCLVSTSIKITCTNQTNRNKTTVVATEGASSIKDNIISVFGPKQISSLIDITLTKPDSSMLQEFGIKSTIEEENIPFTFDCVISTVIHGSGRSTTDRQFYYINSRPCEPTKLMKLVNEVYKQFNSHQYPFVYLNIKMKTSEIDVNVTPDKRQIFIEKEKLLCATMKASLLEAFKMFPSTYKMQNLNLKKENTEETKSVNIKLESRGLKRNLSEHLDKSDNKSFFDTFQKRQKTNERSPPKSVTNTDKSSLTERKEKESSQRQMFRMLAQNLKKSMNSNEKLTKDKHNHSTNFTSAEQEVEHSDTEHDESTVIVKLDDESPKTQKNVKQIIAKNFVLENIKKVLINQQDKKQSETVVRFRSKIAPETNKEAEKELQKQITKEMFKEMEVIGQFNLAFIIVKLKSDLFIVDQHATDEKYNFEQLQLNTVLEQQVLVNPKPLELTAANESILIENEEILRKNGFTFRIDENAECTKKVLLTSVPLSKNYVFGKDDIEELLFMLQDSNHTMCRPSRVYSMLASRACRKSVMVGHPLSFSDMKRLIIHMGEINQPWNCPHGRPTMRHLVNLDLIQRS